MQRVVTLFTCYVGDIKVCCPHVTLLICCTRYVGDITICLVEGLSLKQFWLILKVYKVEGSS